MKWDTFAMSKAKFSTPFLLYIILFLSVLQISTTGCGDRLPVNPASNVIMPLTVGNVWNMTLSSYRGNVACSDESYSINLETSRKYNSETWYKGDFFSYGGFIYNGQRGLYTRSDSTVILIAKYPAVKGERFEGYYAPLMILPDGTTEPAVDAYTVVASTDTLITVPAGTFSCYAYHTYAYSSPGALPMTEAQSYYAPGIGLIKYVHVFRETDPPQQSGYFIFTLKNYDIKGW